MAASVWSQWREPNSFRSRFATGVISYRLLCMLLEFCSLLPSLLISHSIKKKKDRASGVTQELQHCYHHKQEVLNHSKNTLQSDRHG